MMSPRSVRFKLSLWYVVVLAIGMVLFGAGTWFVLRDVLLANANREIERQLLAVETFIAQEARGNDLPAIREEAREYSSGLQDGQGLRVWGPNGNLILEVKGAAGPALRRRKQLLVRGNAIEVELKLPMEDFYETLSTLRWVMLAVFPLVLGVAISGGWWLAKRALKPVGEMTREARSINATDLAARLSVPPSRDELQSLAEAWNSLLDRIEASVSTVTRFTADAAHELRTPVTVIRAATELALRHPRSLESHRQTLDAIQREAEQMTELIEQLLLLARGDAGQWQFRFDNVFADEMLRQLRKTVSSLADNKHIDLNWNLPDQPTIVLGDESALRRLVMILLDNAIKYTQSGGRVDVGLRLSESDCTIEISDTGCGISTEELPRVFDRFYRADPARTPGNGTGLGLAIARTIVEAHNGRIEAVSSERIGSIFRVILPLALSPSALVERS